VLLQTAMAKWVVGDRRLAAQSSAVTNLVAEFEAAVTAQDLPEVRKLLGLIRTTLTRMEQDAIEAEAKSRLLAVDQDGFIMDLSVPPNLRG